MICPGCGTTFAATATRCEDCNVDLMAAPPERAKTVADDGVGPRRLRLFELALVVGSAFFLPTWYALHDWWTGAAIPPETWVDTTRRVGAATLSIALLAYVLHRRGRSLRSLGLTAKWSDLGWALLIMFFVRLIELPISMATASLDATTLPPLDPWFVLAAIPAAAEEELIVRAFLMTEVAALTGSMVLALVASVVFQTVYHLYLGVQGALVVAGGFFVFAAFYANTRRITPVILAHALFNCWIVAVEAQGNG
jgi:membrane protease YdiL (CAAX protease family)